MDPTSPSSASPLPAQRFALGPRLRAAGIHLGLSALIAALAAALVFGLWYPTPFREISGGRELFFIVVAVDVILGPLITLAVFDRRKPWRELRRDLAIVGVIQVAGLLYGLHTVYVARPAAMVLEVDRLRVLTAGDLPEATLAKAPPEFRELPWHGVHVLAARRATDAERLDAIEMALSGVDISQRPEFWLPASETRAALLQSAKRVQDLRKRHVDRTAELQKYIDATGRSDEQLKFLPLFARRSDWIALLDAGSGELVGYAPFDGF